jgi:hypothetical protein
VLLDPTTSGRFERLPTSVGDPKFTPPSQKGFVITRYKIMQCLLLYNFFTHSLKGEIKQALITRWIAYTEPIRECRRMLNKQIVRAINSVS